MQKEVPLPDEDVRANEEWARQVQEIAASGKRLFMRDGDQDAPPEPTEDQDLVILRKRKHDGIMGGHDDSQSRKPAKTDRTADQPGDDAKSPGGAEPNEAQPHRIISGIEERGSDLEKRMSMDKKHLADLRCLISNNRADVHRTEDAILKQKEAILKQKEAILKLEEMASNLEASVVADKKTSEALLAQVVESQGM